MDQRLPSASTSIVALPGFEVDLVREEVRTVGGDHVVLRPRSFAVLRLLASNLGGIVTKDEFLSAVWDDVSVTEDSLTQCIADIRRALGDTERRMLRTVPRRGYVLIGDCAPRRDTMSSSHHPSSSEAGSHPSARQARPGAEVPDTRYAKCGDIHVAYQVNGDGPLDLVFVQGYVTHLEIEWEDERPANFYRRLASFSRLIRFDRRGIGLSDRVALPTLEERMEDVRAVMDAVGSRRAVLLGSSEGGPMSVLFSAMYPERVAGLILYGSMARTSWAPDYPCGRPPEQQAAILRDMAEKWGQGHSVDRFAPTLASNPEYRKWRGRVDRAGATPAAAAALMHLTYQIDVREVLAAIRVPTLIIHKTDDPAVKVQHGRYLASHIPKAKYVELPGRDHPPWVDSADGIAGTIQAFTRSLPDLQKHDRVLTTLLFAQIMPARNARLEDRVFKELIAQCRILLGEKVEQYRGRRLETLRDGFLAAFDGPARAVRCGLAIVAAFRDLGLQTRAGVHIGECEFLDDRLGGVAVRLATSLTESAAPDEVLVSSTVRDVVAGSELNFEPRETRVFEGIPGNWPLLAALETPHPTSILPRIKPVRKTAQLS